MATTKRVAGALVGGGAQRAARAPHEGPCRPAWALPAAACLPATPFIAPYTCSYSTPPRHPEALAAHSPSFEFERAGHWPHRA